MYNRLGRSLWHLLGRAFSPALGFLFPRNIVLIILGAITALFIASEIARFISHNFNEWVMSQLKIILKEKERVHILGGTYMLLAAFAVFLLFSKEIAIAVLLFWDVGDLMASIVGRKFGRLKMGQKSLEGSLACLASCVVVGVILRLFLPLTFPMLIAGALAATIIEFLSIPINDNVTMPVASGAVMALVALF